MDEVWLCGLKCMQTFLIFECLLVLKTSKNIKSLAGVDSKIKTEHIVLCSRLNQSAKYHLEGDLKEKYKAQCIDHTCTLMTVNSIKNQLESKNNNSILPRCATTIFTLWSWKYLYDLKSLSGLVFSSTFPHSANAPNEMYCMFQVFNGVVLSPSLSSAVTPQQWENTSEMNIAKAERQKTNSLSLRVFTQSVLEQTAADMQKQVQATKVAFQVNVNQIKSAKSQMEDQLSKVKGRAE